MKRYADLPDTSTLLRMAWDRVPVGKRRASTPSVRLCRITTPAMSQTSVCVCGWLLNRLIVISTQYVRAQTELVKAGASLTAAAIRGEEIHIASVGASRAYLIRDGEIEQSHAGSHTGSAAS